ncbi:MAG: FAD-dependent oxidoreductase [Acidimicrobiales bacterium]
MTDAGRERSAPVVAESDVVVVGGGSAGVAAAVAAARQGASVTLVERYGCLGGMASGGMVLVLDDMVNGAEITVKGICAEFIGRLERLGLAVYPPPEAWGDDPASIRRWSRWGASDFHFKGSPKPICYSVAFDPDGWKRVSLELVAEAGVKLRLHSWAAEAVMDGATIRGVRVLTKKGLQEVRGRVVVDASGDADIVVTAGAPFVHDRYLVTTVFRLGGVDVEESERHAEESPREAALLNRRAKLILGGAWENWWLRTPLPGIVWCNCPHLTGYDGVDPESQTAAEMAGRERVYALVEFARANLPGFEGAFVVDVASQLGVRQTRLAVGEYVVTASDITCRRHFPDSVARGRNYYTPYRALVPRAVDGLLVAGRHYSAEPEAQRQSREIPPCMSMGEAAGVAAALSVETSTPLLRIDVAELQRRLRSVGHDPGDVPSANATREEPPDSGDPRPGLDETAEAVARRQETTSSETEVLR